MKHESSDSAFEPMPEPENKAPETALADTPEASGTSDADQLKQARRNIFIGAAWCFGGLLVTLLTYHLAEEGGRFVVAYGAVVWGLIQAAQGLFSYIGIKRRLRDARGIRRAVTLALCGLAAAGYLGYLSLRTATGGETLDREQQWSCEELGLRATVPAGYRPFSESFAEETDSTYARHVAFVTSPDEWEFSISGLPGAVASDVERIADISDFCMQRDSAFFDGGILRPAELRTVAGIEMLCAEGYRTEWPGFVFLTYDLLNRHSLISVSIIYPQAEYGTETAQRRIDGLLQGIETY